MVLKGKMMKSCSWLVGLFLVGMFVGCGGAPEPVEVPEADDAAVNMADDEVAAERGLKPPKE